MLWFAAIITAQYHVAWEYKRQCSMKSVYKNLCHAMRKFLEVHGTYV